MICDPAGLKRLAEIPEWKLWETVILVSRLGLRSSQGPLSPLRVALDRWERREWDLALQFPMPFREDFSVRGYILLNPAISSGPLALQTKDNHGQSFGGSEGSKVPSVWTFEYIVLNIFRSGVRFEESPGWREALESLGLVPADNPFYVQAGKGCI